MTEFKQGVEIPSLEERLRKAEEGQVVTMPEVASLEEQVAAAEFRSLHPDLTLENSGWAGCRVTFRRESDHDRISVDLEILPHYYRGNPEGFTLTAEEREMAYQALSDMGVDIDDYVIEKAEMYKNPWILENERELPDFKELEREAKRRAAERVVDPEVKRQLGFEC